MQAETTYIKRCNKVVRAVEAFVLSSVSYQDSLAPPSQACTLYFRHAHRTCSARARCRHEARSTANTRAHTTTGCSFSLLLRYSKSSLAGRWKYYFPSTSASSWHRIDPEGSQYTLEGDNHLSTLCCLRCRKCNGLADRHREEHRTPCSSRPTIRQDMSCFRHAHSYNARCPHHREECSEPYTRHQATTVDSLSYHQKVCICHKK